MSEKIIFSSSDKLSDSILESYCSSFNEIFLKNYDIDFFKKKYTGNFKGFSYHSLLVDEINQVYAACTIMPSLYLVDKKEVYVGTLVDVFINPEKRKDPFLLLKLYNKIVNNDRLKSLQLVIAVPNSNAYKYWIKVVKFKHIGDLNYQILPILSGKLKIFGYLSSFLFLKISSFLNYFFTSSISRPISKIECNRYFENRFIDGIHNKIIINNEEVYFRIMNEKNFNVAFLLNLGLNFKFNLFKSLLEISKIRNIDFIAFIGNLPVRQFSMIKLPHKIHPQQLPLCIKLIDKSIPEKSIKKLYNIKNWDFSLYNFDTR